MRALIIFAHPEPNSFNGALRDVASARMTSQGYSVEISDLYAEGFDPVEDASHYQRRKDLELFSPLIEQRHAYETKNLPTDVTREIERLQRADVVIFQFPIWWHSVPAILKGWLDRVFVNGGLYTSSMRYDHGVFRNKRALLSVTTGAPEVAFLAGGRGGEMASILWPMQYSLHYMGFSVLPPFVSYGVAGPGYHYEDEKEKMGRLGLVAKDWSNRLTKVGNDQPIVFPGWASWKLNGSGPTTDEVHFASPR